MTTSSDDGTPPSTPLVEARTRVVSVDGVEFVYRDLSSPTNPGIPVVALTHLGANLDSWDPEVVDPISEQRRVILIGYRGVGGSSGTVRDSFEAMAADAIAVIRALGFERVDLLGLSMGGMVVQALLEQDPDLVDRVVFAGTGPRGGPGLTRMNRVMLRGILRGMATFTPPTTLLFFTRSRDARRAASEYQARLRLRRTGRDAAVGLSVIRSQLCAVDRWGRDEPIATPTARVPVLILHGIDDRMVPVGNVDALCVRFPDAHVQTFPDSGHGVVSQNRRVITASVLRFLQR